MLPLGFCLEPNLEHDDRLPDIVRTKVRDITVEAKTGIFLAMAGSTHTLLGTGAGRGL